MTWWMITLIVVFVFLLLLAAGMPIGFAFGLAMAFTYFVFSHESDLLSMVPTITHEVLTNFIFLCFPLFILMAEILEATGISKTTYDAADKWLSRLPGGLAVANVMACAAFGAVCGASAATVATMGRISVPILKERNYDNGLSTGSVASGGGLALMIPPSIHFIMYGVLTGVSVGKMFIAGILPGIMSALLFSIYIITRVIINPNLAPSMKIKYTWKEKLFSLFKIAPILILFLCIMISIYMGIATPTESAAIACLISLLLAFLHKSLSWDLIWTASKKATVTTGIVALVIVGGKLFSHLFVTIGTGQLLTDAIISKGLTPNLVIAAMVLILFILGMFMEGSGIIVLTIPIFFPIIINLGFDPVWFGIITTICVELALITPPVGVNVYLLAGIVEPYGIRLSEVFKGNLPFVLLQLLAIGLLMIFPQIATWLPSMMKN